MEIDLEKNAIDIISHIEEFYKYGIFNENTENLVNKLENNLTKTYEEQGNMMILKLIEPFNLSIRYPNIKANLKIDTIINPQGEIGLFEKKLRYLFFTSSQKIINNNDIMNQAIKKDKFIALASVEKHHIAGDYFLNERLFILPYISGEIGKFNKKGQLRIPKNPQTPLLSYSINNF